ncbi:MAG: antibiotic biosynthesis monooxygenase [Nitrososphaerota archaeon]|nr:antibiotic biosynthesis monooxygenase [Nitrososphaerota archaeon]
MIVVQNHIPVKNEYREQFEKLFAGGTRYVQNAPGFVRNEILRPIKGDAYIVQTYWESQETFQSWVKSEDFKKAHSNSAPDDMFAGESFLEIHEIVVSTERK